MVQIDVKDRASAEKWQGEVQTLNIETENLLKELSQTLDAVTTGAEGEIVTKIAALSTKTMEATKTIMEGMIGLFNVVGEVLKTFDKMVDKAKNDMENTIKNFFSR